jgi:hypothetical protein
VVDEIKARKAEILPVNVNGDDSDMVATLRGWKVRCTAAKLQFNIVLLNQSTTCASCPRVALGWSEAVVHWTCEHSTAFHGITSGSWSDS